MNENLHTKAEDAANIAVQKTTEAQEAIEASRLAAANQAAQKYEEVIINSTIEAKKNALEVILKAEGAAKNLIETAERVSTKLHEKKPEWFKKHEEDDTKAFQTFNLILQDQNKTLASIQQESKDFHTKSTPMIEWFEDMTLGRKIKWNWVTSTSKIGGVILVIIAIMGSIWAGIKFLVLNAIK